MLSHMFLFILILYYIILLLNSLRAEYSWHSNNRVDGACLLFDRWGTETFSANINSIDLICKARATT